MGRAHATAAKMKEGGHVDQNERCSIGRRLYRSAPPRPRGDEVDGVR